MFVLYGLYEALKFSIFPEKGGQNQQLLGDFYFSADEKGVTCYSSGGCHC